MLYIIVKNVIAMTERGIFFGFYVSQIAREWPAIFCPCLIYKRNLIIICSQNSSVQSRSLSFENLNCKIIFLMMEDINILDLSVSLTPLAYVHGPQTVLQQSKDDC